MQVDKADQEAFRAAVAADRKKGLTGKGRRSPYTLGFWGQVKALTIRMVQQKLQDRFQLVTSWILSMVRPPIPRPLIYIWVSDMI